MTVTYPVGDHRILKLGRAGAGEAPFPMHWTGSGILLKAACAALDVRFKAEYDSQAPWAAVLIDGVLELNYLENHGAAFGMMEGRGLVFAAAAVFFMAAAVWFLLKTPAEKKYLPACAVCTAAFAGAAGNLFDRIALGYVRDFIYVSLIDFPVFNFADICVTCSMAAAFFLILFYYKDGDFQYLSRRKADA